MTASQADLWSGPVGDSWVRNASAYDRILEPLGRAALDLLELAPHERVVDIGCVEQNPLVMTLLVANPDARQAALSAAATALGHHVHGGEVSLGAGTWLVQARALRA